VSTIALRGILDRTYSRADYPVLDRQARQWEATRPLAGVRLLDATPLFTNTLAKYVPLLSAGAELHVALSPLLPHDPQVAASLSTLGVPVITATEGPYDVVMDCAGVLSAVPTVRGYVELTKSGEHVYTDCAKPVVLVDDSRTKHIETSLGTGEGFLRALAHFGYPDLTGRSVVVFGAGKVGRGAAVYARDAGAVVSVIDLTSKTEYVRESIDHAWCVVSATGVAGALAPLTDQLRDGQAILVNLGAEDEFGPDMPADRVLNQKVPVNFALPEPTRLRYMDATMALVNACALALLTQDFAPGLCQPPVELEDEILDVVRGSAIADELGRLSW
jgi:adenosylhomocysteinase